MRVIWKSALVLLGGMALSCVRMSAQAVPTATGGLKISAFAGVAGNYTGLLLAKNLDVTAGLDIGFRSFAGFYPALEGRGLYPVDKGQTVALENLLGGLRLGRHDRHFSGYGDLLYGRGRLDFAGGYPNAANTFLVVSNTTAVLSFGGGVDVATAGRFGFKGDFQLQRYDTPVTVSGELYSKVFTVALVYRFGTSGLNGLRGRHF